MKNFSNLYKSLLSTNNLIEQKLLMVYYLQSIDDLEKMVSIRMLTSDNKSRIIGSKALIKLVAEEKKIPDWLMEACHQATTDWIEACSLLVANPTIEASDFLLSTLVHAIENLQDNKSDFIIKTWSQLSTTEVWIFNKIITGTLRPIFPTNEMADLLSNKWGVSRELIQLRLSLGMFSNLSFVDLLAKERNDLEREFLPYDFAKPSDWYINFNLENHTEYSVEPFVFGDRKFVIKNKFAIIAYTTHGVWEKTDGTLWQVLLPYNSRIECIEQGEKIFITKIVEWNGLYYEENNKANSIVDNWISQNNLSDGVNLIYSQTINHWNEINSNADLIIKHKNNPDKWYRIKPKPPELTATLWYAEMNENNLSMKFEFALAIENETKELITIARLPSDCLTETDQTKLYFWIQNNSVKKTGPVRTVRPGQYFQISYDRSIENKRLKAKRKLINVRLIKWIPGNQEHELSKLSDITQ